MKAIQAADRHHPHEGPLRVLVGKERFSENHAWSEMPQYWPGDLVGRAVIEVVGQGQLEARLVDGGPPVDVVVPLWSPLPGRAIRAGSFGLIQQFGVGVDNIDLDAAADEGVWVANMPGLNAVPVAEHAVALLLALARRLPEASKGFEPGRWGEPAGRSPAHRSDRPHRRPNQRLLRSRQPTIRRCPRQLPRSSATRRTPQMSRLQGAIRDDHPRYKHRPRTPGKRR
jgi:hypothetical protein